MSKNWPQHRRNAPSAAQQTFLDALWRVIGTSLADHILAAQRLKVPLSYIRDLFEGRRRPDPNIVRHQGWAPKLARHYPEGWEADGEILAAFAPNKRTPTRRRGRVGDPPGRSCELGRVLAAIIGPYEDVNRVAGILGGSKSMVGQILLERRSANRATVMGFDAKAAEAALPRGLVAAWRPFPCNTGGSAAGTRPTVAPLALEG